MQVFAGVEWILKESLVRRGSTAEKLTRATDGECTVRVIGQIECVLLLSMDQTLSEGCGEIAYVRPQDCEEEAECEAAPRQPSTSLRVRRTTLQSQQPLSEFDESLLPTFCGYA